MNSPRPEIRETYFTATPDIVGLAIPADKPLYHAVLFALVHLGRFRYECFATVDEIRSVSSVCPKVIREFLGWMVRMGFLRIVKDTKLRSGRYFEMLWRRVPIANADENPPRASRPSQRIEVPLSPSPREPQPRPRGTPAAPPGNPPFPIRERERKTSDVRDGDVSLSLKGDDPEPSFSPTPDEIARWEQERDVPGHRGVMAKHYLRMLAAARQEAESAPPAPPPPREVSPPAPRHDPPAPPSPPGRRVYRDERYTPARALELMAILPACPEAVDQLARHLGKRWRDEKPETLAHFAGVLDAARQGLIGPEELAGLFKDSDRPKINRPANHFASHSGRVLADARRVKKPGLGCARQSPPRPGPQDFRSMNTIIR